MRKIPITKPYFDDREFELIQKPLETGWVVQGPYISEFEEKFKNFTKSKFAIATSNCTTALHLGLEVLGVKAGDQVVVPALTYVSCANVVDMIGAEVVFCDVDLTTFNLDTNQLRQILENDKNQKIKVIMAVDLFGLCANFDEILPLAEKYNVKVLEDAACGFGSRLKDKHAGTFGEIGCFSFHPRKAITTGEGGMLVTDNAQYAELAQKLRDHGADVTDFARHDNSACYLLPEFPVRGYNYRMTDMQGALGVAQMEKAIEILKKRRDVSEKYWQKLKSISFLQLPSEPDGYYHSFQAFVCLFTNGLNLEELTLDKIQNLHKRRNQFMSHLSEKGIGVRPGTHAVHALKYYKDKYGLKSEDFKNAFLADQLSVALPLYVDMTDDEFSYVIEMISCRG